MQTLYEAQNMAKALNDALCFAEDGVHLGGNADGGHYQLIQTTIKNGWRQWVPCYHHSRGAYPSDCEGGSRELRVAIAQEAVRRTG